MRSNPLREITTTPRGTGLVTAAQREPLRHASSHARQIIRQNVPPEQHHPAAESWITILIPPLAVGAVLARNQSRIVRPIDCVGVGPALARRAFLPGPDHRAPSCSG